MPQPGEVYDHSGPIIGNQSEKKSPTVWERINEFLKGSAEKFVNDRFKPDGNFGEMINPYKDNSSERPKRKDPEGDPWNAPGVLLSSMNPPPEEDDEVNNPEEARAMDEYVYGSAKLPSLVDDEEYQSPIPKFPIKEMDDQIGLLKGSINKLEKRPNEIDFSPIASYLGMDARAFKPDMTRSEKEKMVLGLKEKVAELSARKQEAMDKQQFYLERERVRQRERAQDRKLRLMSLQERFGRRVAGAAQKAEKDQETLASQMRSQNKDALQYLASLQHGFADEDMEDPNIKARAKAYRDLAHKQITESARALMKQDASLKFNDAYRMVLDEAVKMEEENRAKASSEDNS